MVVHAAFFPMTHAFDNWHRSITRLSQHPRQYNTVVRTTSQVKEKHKTVAAHYNNTLLIYCSLVWMEGANEKSSWDCAHNNPHLPSPILKSIYAICLTSASFPPCKRSTSYRRSHHSPINTVVHLMWDSMEGLLQCLWAVVALAAMCHSLLCNIIVQQFRR